MASQRPPKGQIVAFFQRHLVPIHVTYRRDDAVGYEIYSAFAVDIAGTWCLVSAGHCLSEMGRAAKEGYDVSVNLLDSVRRDARFREPIPFGYDPEFVFHMDEPYGFDYGLIILEDNYRRLLEVNGTLALNEETWKPDTTGSEYYALLGIAGDLTGSDGKTASIATAIQFLEALPERPDYFEPTPAPRFYARAKMGEGISGLRGFSGGPIFAFRHIDGNLRYWLHAIQSSWIPAEKVLAACLMRPFSTEVECVLRSVMGSLERPNSERSNDDS